MTKFEQKIASSLLAEQPSLAKPDVTSPLVLAYRTVVLGLGRSKSDSLL